MTIIDWPQEPLWHVSEWDRRVQVAALLLSPFLITWMWTSAQCFLTLRQQQPGSKAPTVPFTFPVLSHTLQFAFDTANYLKCLRERFGQNPVRLHIGADTMTFVPHGNTVLSFFRNSKELHSKQAALQALRNSFGMPEEDLKIYEADDSGIAAEPAPGTEHIDPSQRFWFQAHRNLQNNLQGSVLNVMTGHFLNKYAHRIEAKTEIKYDEWTEYPDFYAFMRDDLFHAALEALCGDHIFEVVPTFCEDFWEFDQNLSTIFKRVPRWLAPKAWASRDKVLANIRKYHQYGDKHFDWDNDEQANAPWEPIWGARVMRGRQQLFRKLGQSKLGDSSTDLGMIWATNANVIPSAFWTLLGVLRSDSLQERLIAEITPTFQANSLTFDINELCSGPLLTSMYMETLRHAVGVVVARSPTIDDYRIGPWSFNKSDIFIALTWQGHRDEAFWNTGRILPTGKQEHPVDTWWAERFLEYPGDAASGPIRKPDPEVYRYTKAKEKTHEDDKHAKVVTTGIQGHWFPYGGGIKMCPGRFFAKQEMMAGVAMMLRAFEIELLDPVAAGKAQPDMGYFPFGALPPDRKIAVRVRRRRL